MARVPLISAAYAGQSIIASGQECVNLYAESNVASKDNQAPVPVTLYHTPGTTLYATPDIIKSARGCYRTSIGTAYYVVGQNVYFLTTARILVFVGFIADRQSQVYFSDNGQVVVLVDGVNGYVIDIHDNTFSIISDPSFYGADFVLFLDTFFVFNRPRTNQFYISASNASYGMLTNSAIESGSITNAGSAYTNGVYPDVPLTGGVGSDATVTITIAGGIVTLVDIVNPGIHYILGNVLSVNSADVGGTGAGFSYTVTGLATAFDPLDVAAKSGFSDPIVGMTAVHRELQLIGELTTEVWIGTGAADFYFQQVQGAFINHGCAAQYSITSQDVGTFFIMQDQQGSGLVVKLIGYDISEISTPRIVKEFKSYDTLSDAIGFSFQIEDHAFVGFTFPTANKTWIMDLKSEQWSEWNWTDNDGNLNRHRINCTMFVYDSNLIGDWENGRLLELRRDIDTDVDGQPIIRIRTFPHMIQNNDKVTTLSFDADMSVGTIKDQEDTPQVSLSWSDNKGVSYGNPVMQDLGKTGKFLTTVSWNRLGQARDRVFKLSWSINAKIALNGAFVERKRARA